MQKPHHDDVAFAFWLREARRLRVVRVGIEGRSYVSVATETSETGSRNFSCGDKKNICDRSYSWSTIDKSSIYCYADFVTSQSEVLMIFNTPLLKKPSSKRFTPDGWEICFAWGIWCVGVKPDGTNQYAWLRTIEARDVAGHRECRLPGSPTYGRTFMGA